MAKRIIRSPALQVSSDTRVASPWLEALLLGGQPMPAMPESFDNFWSGSRTRMPAKTAVWIRNRGRIARVRASEKEARVAQRRAWKAREGLKPKGGLKAARHCVWVMRVRDLLLTETIAERHHAFHPPHPEVELVPFWMMNTIPGVQYPPPWMYSQ